jgi:hypothetical protein
MACKIWSLRNCPLGDAASAVSAVWCMAAMRRDERDGGLVIDEKY